MQDVSTATLPSPTPFTETVQNTSKLAFFSALTALETSFLAFRSAFGVALAAVFLAIL